MDFTAMDINTISTGVSADGVRYLQLFLQEYTSIFHETVNPGCSKCLNTYFTKYINHMKKANNTSGYRLKPKYENIPLEFGSPIFVNNGNIDTYAKQLIKNHPLGKELFEVIPEDHSDDTGAGTGDKKPEVSLTTLQANLEKAKEEFAGLAPNAHHATRKSKETAVKKAEEALAAFQAEQENANNLPVKTEGESEITLSADDLTANPELSEAGYLEGDVVIIDQKELDDNGKIHVLRRKE